MRASIAAENVAGIAGVRVGNPGSLPNLFSDDEIVVYHHSTGSDLATAFGLARGALRVLVYHNITPPDLLAHAPDLAARSHLGMRQLGELLRAADLVLADSAYNLRELGGYALSPAMTAPLVLAPDRWSLMEEAADRRRPDSPTCWLFVGRLVPHKRIELLVRALRIYREQHDAAARLLVVGPDDEAPAYAAELRAFAENECRWSVEFAGKRIGEDLRDSFARATLFVTASAHEGFCVPLVEAMVANLPIVAVQAGAIGETLGGTGVLLDAPDPAMIAEAAQILASDSRSRESIVRAQRQRAAAFTAERLENVIRAALE
jgi:glycosyltransferase involved in cell wall biosynthesis